MRLSLFEQHKHCTSGVVIRGYWLLVEVTPFQSRQAASYIKSTFYSTMLSFLHVGVLFTTSRRSKCSASVNSHLKNWPFALTSKETTPTF